MLVFWPIGPWERVPCWHWRAWFGYSWRRRNEDYNFHIGDDRWEYATEVQCARIILEETYGSEE